MSVKVLLTGGSGMVGQAVRRCVQNNAGRGWELHAPDRRELDLLDKAAVKACLQGQDFDLVIHCAAKVGGIQTNIADPAGFYVDNIVMNTTLIEAARAAGIGNLLFLGSSCMYPKDLGRPLVEDDILSAPLEPTNEGYALAKIAGARHCAYISRQYGLNYKTLIPPNLYGPGDSFAPAKSHLVPAIIDKLHKARTTGRKSVEIWGDGTARREFMYVDDLARYLVKCYDFIAALPEVLNVGTGYDYSVNEYYEYVAKTVGYTGGFHHKPDAPVGMMSKLMSSRRARNCHWQPQTSLKEGLRKTYEYYLGTLDTG